MGTFSPEEAQQNHCQKKSKYWLKTHKFGIEIPKSVLQERQIDAKSGNTVWWDAICKEMKNVRAAFEAFEGGVEQLPSGFQEIKCHMIFHSVPILRKPCTTLDSSQPEQIQTFGVDQQLKRMCSNIMNTSYVMLMTSLPLAIRQRMF